MPSFRLLIRNQPHTDEEHVYWDSEDVPYTNETAAKSYATKIARWDINERPLKGRWETKAWGFVRWHKSVCIQLIDKAKEDLLHDPSAVH